MPVTSGGRNFILRFHNNWWQQAAYRRNTNRIFHGRKTRRTIEHAQTNSFHISQQLSTYFFFCAQDLGNKLFFTKSCALRKKIEANYCNMHTFFYVMWLVTLLQILAQKTGYSWVGLCHSWRSSSCIITSAFPRDRAGWRTGNLSTSSMCWLSTTRFRWSSALGW